MPINANITSSQALHLRGGFDPRTLPGFVAFLDGYDLAALGAGAAVASWAPKYGDAAYTATGSGSARPLVTTTLNGATFDGTNDMLAFSAAPLNFTRNAGSVTLYCAAGGIAATVGRLVFFSNATGPGNSRSVLSRSGTGYDILGRRLDADNAAILSATAAGTRTEVVCAVLDYANTRAAIYLNGVSVASSAFFLTAGTTSDTASNAAALGAAPSGVNYLTGTIYGVILCRSAAHDAATVATVSAWLKARYGI